MELNIIGKIKEVLSRHKSRIDDLEKRVIELEKEVLNPYKMPFDI